MVNLNYDASVPLAKISVKDFIVEDASVPGDHSVRDFVLNPNRDTKALPQKKPDAAPFRSAIIKRGPEDYISRSVLEAIVNKEKQTIIAMAKEIYNRDAKKRRDYKQAKKLLRKVKPEEFENPTDEIKRAMIIVNKHKPVTKKEAMQLATKQYRLKQGA